MADSRPQTQTQTQTQTQIQNPSQNPDHNADVKEISPNVGRRRFQGDLVETTDFLFVKLVKAKELPQQNVYVEVVVGDFKAMSEASENKPNPIWNQVFTLSKDRIESSTVVLTMRDKYIRIDEYFVGRVVFEIASLLRRVPPDSPLAAEWCSLKNSEGQRAGGHLMVAAWMGTQGDETFPDAWHLDAVGVSGDGVAAIRSKVYRSPNLWYLRVNVIDAQDLVPSHETRPPEVSIKVRLGNWTLGPKYPKTWSVNNVVWNENFLFTVCEPFEDCLILSVDCKVGPNEFELLGQCIVPLENVEKRLGTEDVIFRCYTIERRVAVEGGQREEMKVVGKIRARLSFDGGYHVFDESPQYTSDRRPTAKELCKPSVGIFELGILSAQGLKKENQRTNAYCVAKYGQKWIRTRTIIDSINPKWNEKYTWEVFDPCTSITIVVFDNCYLQGLEGNGEEQEDARIGKVRIRLSTLKDGRVYTLSYPLIVLHPSGLKKTGEIQLALRFSYLSFVKVLQMYSKPLLPEMHYLHPLSVAQQCDLRHQVTRIIVRRMSRAEPPLRKEVVEYMLDAGLDMWSIRRSKVNFFRVVGVLTGFHKWVDEICTWKSPFKTISVHIGCVVAIFLPELIVLVMLMYLFAVGLQNYRKRAKHPPHMDPRLSLADTANADELDEEFDTFPSSRHADVAKARYDKLRCLGAVVQNAFGEVATQGERFHSLLSWRDPIATGLFMAFCFIVGILLLLTPTRVLCLMTSFYVMRHPRLRGKLPSVPFNFFFKRLPTKDDNLM